MTSELKLLPCPFCGSRPVVELGKLSHCQLHGEPMQSVTIRCKKHECWGKPSMCGGDIYNGGKHKATAEVARRWNARHISDDMVERAARAICSVELEGENLHCVHDTINNSRKLAKAALTAALKGE